MRLYKPKHPTRPTLPDQFSAYPELFRSYLRRLEEYFLWRSQAYQLMFSDGLGSFTHLFAVSGVDIHYISYMTACYHLGLDGSMFTTRRLGDITPITLDTLRDRNALALERGHISAFKRNRYVITPAGIEYVEEQAREFYRRLLKLYDIT